MSSIVGKKVKKSPNTPDVNQNDRSDSKQTQRLNTVINVQIAWIFLSVWLSEILSKFPHFRTVGDLNKYTKVEEEAIMFCHHCDDSLAGHRFVINNTITILICILIIRYVLRDDHPYCIKCYENVFANNCDECGKIIGIDSKDLSYKEKHWHEACFLCNKCRTSLVDKQFGSKADRIYCGPCYDAQFATRCDGCGDVFKAGMKKMEYKTRQWHEKCFVCCTCKNPIGTKSFIPKEHDIYCAKCYEEKFATKCIKCSKVRANIITLLTPWSGQIASYQFLLYKYFLFSVFEILDSLSETFCDLKPDMCLGDYPGRCDLQEWSLAQGMLHLHSLSEVSCRWHLLSLISNIMTINLFNH